MRLGGTIQEIEHLVYRHPSKRQVKGKSGRKKEMGKNKYKTENSQGYERHKSSD